MNPASLDEEAEEPKFKDSIRQIDEVVYILSCDIVIREQKADDTVNHIRGWVTNGRPPKRN